MSSRQPAIELVGVDKRYRIYRQRYRSLKEVLFHRSFGEWEDRWALRGVDLRVEAGGSLGLIGPNGAGKSTALKLMARILQPDRGDVRTRGRVAGLLELGAGFQPEYTGRENVYLNASLLGLTRAEVRRRFDEIVGFAELEEFIDDPVRTYSSGRYLRLGFAIAVNVDPEVMLVDEIFAVGDESFQRKCLEWMESFQARGGTIVMVSHQMNAIRDMCTEAVWIEGGRVREQGDPRQVCNSYVDWVRDSQGEGPDLRLVEEPERPAIELGEARLLNEHGLPAGDLTPGDSLVVEIPYQVHRGVSAPVFGVAIYRNDGLYVYGANTVFSGFQLPPLRRRGSIRLRYPRLPLMAGTYRITVSVLGSHRPNSPPLDTHLQRYSFRVVSRDLDQGAVRLEHEWEMGPSPAQAGEAGA